MRRAWASVAAATLACACSGGQQGWQPVHGTVRGAGLEVTLVSTSVDDRPAPWKPIPSGSHCVVYALRVRSTDGSHHELRPDEFEADQVGPAAAVPHCFSDELEPTWVDGQPKMVQVTLLESSPTPVSLMWRPPGGD